MKRFILAVFATCFALPAMAQTWGGSPVTPELLDGLPASNGGAYGGGVYGEQWLRPSGGYTQNLTLTCIDPAMPSNPVTLAACTADQLSRNAVNTYSDYTSFTLNSQTYTPRLPVTTIPELATVPGSKVGVLVSGVYADPSSPSGVSYFSGVVPLSAFAPSGSGGVQPVDYQPQLDNLSARIDAFVAGQQTAAAQIERNRVSASRGIAMASSLSMIAPAQGRNNRVGLGFGTFADENALSINYTHVSGDLDMGFAAAFSGGDKLAKGSVGFSW